MNQSGLICTGSWRSNFPSGLDHAQFSQPVIKVALRLLNGLDAKARADVVEAT